jgi:hypothetical protein
MCLAQSDNPIFHSMGGEVSRFHLLENRVSMLHERVIIGQGKFFGPSWGLEGLLSFDSRFSKEVSLGLLETIRVGYWETILDIIL